MADLPIAEEPAIAESEVTEEKPAPSQVEGPKARRRPRAPKPVPGATGEKPDEAVEAEPVLADQAPATEEKARAAEETAEGPKRKTRARKKVEDAPVEPKPAPKKAVATPTPEPSNEDAPAEPRRGWWQRTFG